MEDNGLDGFRIKWRFGQGFNILHMVVSGNNLNLIATDLTVNDNGTAGFLIGQSIADNGKLEGLFQFQ